jgi:glycine/D-amino acid oxidase-like deaminating enzyme
MGPQVDPVASDPKIPARADVVIVGGGIVGTSAALFLAERGVSVVLCEKGHIAGEQSSRNWGWCRKTRRDPREIPLIIESMRLWEDMNERVEAETGFRTSGILFVAEDEAQIARYENWLEHARLYQLDARLVSGNELENLMPGTSGRWKAALYSPLDGRAEPQKAAPAIARAAQRKGAVILTDCAVRGLDTQGGRVAAAITERGRIVCDTVVLAGGAWSSRFCQDLNLRLPQLKVRASVMRTAPLDGAPETALWTNAAAFRKRLDGGYSIADGHANVAPIVPDSFRFLKDFLPAIRMDWDSFHLRLDGRFLTEWREGKRVPLDQPSPYERARVLDPEPDQRFPKGALAALAKLFPAFADAKVVQQWAGLIDVMPDVIPVISPVETLPGFVIATGFSGHGFGIGPGAGRLVADLVTGADPVVDPTPFRYSRFTDGSRPEPIGGI